MAAVLSNIPTKVVGKPPITAERHAAAIKYAPGAEWKNGTVNRAALQAATGSKRVTTHEITRRRDLGEEYIKLSPAPGFRRRRRVADCENNMLSPLKIGALGLRHQDT